MADTVHQTRISEKREQIMMLTKKLGAISLPEEEVKQDKKNCRKFGPCGVGKKALYLNSFYIDRQYYVPVKSVTRIFKRVAMSKGGFTGKGIFGTLPYLVVEYDNGKQKQCNFKHEEDVDRLLAFVETNFPNIPLHLFRYKQHPRCSHCVLKLLSAHSIEISHPLLIIIS